MKTKFDTTIRELEEEREPVLKMPAEPKTFPDEDVSSDATESSDASGVEADTSSSSEKREVTTEEIVEDALRLGLDMLFKGQ